MPRQQPMTAADFAAVLNVSRETLARLQTYESQLRRWQDKINLVGATTLSDIWRRHFLDCGQLCALIEQTNTVADIGSGAGFPGLVVAIITGAPVTLIEADQRKAVFLREVCRATSASAVVVAERAEHATPHPVDIVTARAVAPVAKLLALAEPWVGPSGRCLFLKSARVEDELTDARQFWDINYELVPSLSDSAGIILHIGEFNRV